MLENKKDAGASFKLSLLKTSNQLCEVSVREFPVN